MNDYFARVRQGRADTDSGILNRQLKFSTVLEGVDP
jgi:hypothetical protein